LRGIEVEPLGQDRFVAPPGGTNDDGRIFGGETLAQAVLAAGRTAEGFEIHSLHAYFLRAGRAGEAITYEVERIREGRAFAGRQVAARQGSNLIFEAMVGFARPEEGIEHQVAPPVVRAPTDEEVAARREREVRRWGGPGAFDMVFVEEDSGMLRGSAPHQTLWTRPAAPLPDDPLVHAAAMASMTDNMLYGTVYEYHKLPPGVSLDHSIWWHRPPRWDGWLLRVADSPVAHAARSLMVASMFDAEGHFVASVAQEGLFRRDW
jgi:acyl-CoA thioesterase-2